MATPLALETEHTLQWRSRATRAALELAATGRIFTADDLHTATVGEPTHHSEWGSIMRDPQVRKAVKSIGFTYSARTGGVLRVWQGKPGTYTPLHSKPASPCRKKPAHEETTTAQRHRVLPAPGTKEKRSRWGYQPQHRERFTKDDPGSCCYQHHGRESPEQTAPASQRVYLPQQTHEIRVLPNV